MPSLAVHSFLVLVLAGGYLVLLVYEGFRVRPQYDASISRTLRRYQLGTKIVTLLVLQVVTSAASVVLRLYIIRVTLLDGTTEASGWTVLGGASYIILMIISAYKLYDFLRNNDDNWFSKQWKRLRKWTTSLRAKRSAPPKFA